MSAEGSSAISALIDYALKHDLIEETDAIWASNQVACLIGESDVALKNVSSDDKDIQDLLDDLTLQASRNKVIDNTRQARDLLDTKISNVLMMRPSECAKKFEELYKISPNAATDWFYAYCKDLNYVRSKRLAQNLSWSHKSIYGDVDITINLSKPEKDPTKIAEALKQKSVNYPKCQLCLENEGYAGRLDYDSRDNLRIIPGNLGGEKWGFQYSPYGYFNEHCIVLSYEHRPMKIDKGAFSRLLEFVDKFPTYFLGSNADLPVVGGSILTHDHYQGGKTIFPMDRARVKKSYNIAGFEDVSVEHLNWPLSAIRLTSSNKEHVVSLADRILGRWRKYSDTGAGVYGETDGVPHNTITPIARKDGDKYVLNLVLRCNIASEEYPLGVFHPHPQYHHVKKENIGLIEVMGLAILPPRLKQEVEDGKITKEEIGEVFVHVLEDAGVFKNTPEGDAQFDKFMEEI